MKNATPTGFRDFMPKEARRRESLNTAVQALLDSRGYAPIETPTLERLDVLQRGGRVPGNPITLFDAEGDLLAMRPDVTLQVARMCATRLADQEGPFRFRYSTRVFRELDVASAQREMTQIGMECIGESDAATDAEVVGLMVESLNTCGLEDYKISLATVAVFNDLLANTAGDAEWRKQVREAYHASNLVELDRLCGQAADDPFSVAIQRLSRIRGGKEAILAARQLTEPLNCANGLEAFQKTFEVLQQRGLAERLLVDFSVISSFDYYTGMVFEVYSPLLGTPLGGGGRYDHVLAAYGQQRVAAGFAFYLELVMKAVELAEKSPAKRPLRIAVPKGSLNKDAIACLEAAGLDTGVLSDPGRLLIVRQPDVEYIIVRAQDAPAFVALGGADCGICGEDSLVEANLDVVKLVDLKFGACRFVVAEPEGATQDVEDTYWRLGSIRIATKYPRITKAYYDAKGMQVDIVQLHGNIELGPLIGMAERIVDITATGTTLRENNLRIVDDVLSSTARFFANTCAFRTNPRISQLAATLAANVAEQE